GSSMSSGLESTVAGFLLTFLGIFYLILLAYIIVNYVVRSLGLYRIAKYSGVHNAWLAWIPLADLFLLGKVTGDIQLGSRTLKNTALWLLLVPLIGGAVAVCFYFGFLFVLIVAGVGATMSSSSAALGMMALVGMLMFATFLVVTIAASVVYYVIYGMAYYKLCTKFKDTAHSVFYTLMALFVPLADAILMYKMSKLAKPPALTAPNPYSMDGYNNNSMNMGE
ncbi:MAG TPA: hypothetical protein IAC74_06960, partial [Candidatus Aphodoplasma excrementigallinarum]|nr:hypothetical protein [Candidatus Aphodoplasma excrementigallinarum]